MSTRMNNWLIVLITTMLCVVAIRISDARSAAKLPVVRIGIVRDSPHPCHGCALPDELMARRSYDIKTYAVTLAAEATASIA